MSTYLFKRLSLAIKLTLAMILLILSRTPLHANAEAPQGSGAWSLQSQVAYKLRSISMLSPFDGWAVGYEGISQNGEEYGSVLLHWDGSSWERVTSPRNFSLYAVKMISSSDVWAVGQIGTRLHWDGIEWQDFSCSYVNCVDLYSIDFTSSSDVWAVGYTTFVSSALGKLEHWNGSEWSESSLIPNYMLRCVSAISENDAWSVGRYYINSYTFQTALAHWNGSTWKGTYTNVGTFGLSAVDMLSLDEGWAAGNNYISHYTGGNWVHNFNYYAILTSLEMLSTNDGWIVGGNLIAPNQYVGLILHWDGAAWTMVDNPSSNTLLSIDMISPYEGWAIGIDGIILRYTNYEHVYLPLITR